MRERQKSDDTADYDRYQYFKVQVIDGIYHDELIVTHQYQDERTRQSWEYHAASGNGAAYHQIQYVAVFFCRRAESDKQSYSRADYER